MPRLLFVCPADLGETVLATGALEQAMARFEGVRSTIVCDPAAVSLFRGAPNIDAIHPWDGKGLGPFVALTREGFAQAFDFAVDLAGAPQALAVNTRGRLTRKRAKVLRHVVEDLTELFDAQRPLAPRLWLDDAARAAATDAVPGAGPLLALAPGGVSPGKRWATERFAAVARRLASGPLADARVVLLGAAPRDAEITRVIAASLDADGVTALDLGGRLDLNAAGALLERTTLCIGNDNALAHIAAAVGAPTLTLFGPTDERVRAPYGPRARTLRGRDLEAIIVSGLDERAAMNDVTVDAVEAAALDLLHAGGLR